ncbi:MAG: RbsD/FucU domain-containing protein [Formivibrio sp.]|nr:RbsD/FucU domain-containing protein [Formivibrio sp.]
MLRGINPVITADLLWVLDSMGHGDTLLIADRNFPSYAVAKETVSGRVVELPGLLVTEALEAVLSLFPLDDFVEKPILRMEQDGHPDLLLPGHEESLAICHKMENRPVQMGSLERQAFYAAARQCYAVIRTTEHRPYVNLILKKGTVNP